MPDPTHRFFTTIAQNPTPVASEEAIAQQRRTQLDVIIVAVYLLCVIYVLNRAYNSLVDQTVYRVEAKHVDGIALGESDLKDVVDMDCGFGGPHPFPSQPKYVNVSVKNKSPDTSIYIDWDSSTIVDYSGRSHRAIRMTIDRKIDLSQQQVFSVVAPGRAVGEQLAPEGFLKANDNGTLEAKAPLVDLDKAPKLAAASYGPFIAGKGPIKLTVRLIIQISRMQDGIRSDRWHAISCDVGVWKVPRKVYFPFVPK